MGKYGKYKVTGWLGHGAMGEVHKGEDDKGNVVAIKVMHRHLASIEEYAKRFKREAELAKRLAHPNVVQVLDYGEENHTAYIAMEFVEGANLSDIMKERGFNSNAKSKASSLRSPNANSKEQSLKFPETPPKNGTTNEKVSTQTFTPEEVIKIGRQMAGVLQAANDIGLIHRDIKPANILMDKKNNAKLLDFGLAKDVEQIHSILSSTGMAIGTPPYMSPEQHCATDDEWQKLGIDKNKIDIRCDLYSLGATMYQLLSGKCPFDGPSGIAYSRQHMEEIPTNLHKLNSDIPLNLSQVVDRLLAKKPGDRHQTPAELIEDLNRVERGEVPLKLHKFKKSKKHNPIITFAYVAVTAILLIASSAIYNNYRADNAKTIIENKVSEVKNLLVQNDYNKALQKINALIAKYSVDNPELVKNAKKLRDDIPRLQKIYLAKCSENIKTEKLRQIAEIKAAKLKQDQLKKQQLEQEVLANARKVEKALENKKKELANILRTIQRLLNSESTLQKAKTEIEKAFTLANVDTDEYKEIEKFNKTYNEKWAMRKPKAAVIDFDISSSIKGGITGDAVRDNLEAAMSLKYKLIDRSHIAKIMKELKFQRTDLVGNNIQEFGKIAGVEYLITGRVSQIGNTFTINAKKIRVETAEIIQTASQRANDINEFNYLFAELARVLDMSNKEKEEYLNERKGQYELAMIEGRKYLKAQNWTSAKSAFNKAMAIPGFEYDNNAKDGIKTADGGAELYRKQQVANSAAEKAIKQGKEKLAICAGDSASYSDSQKVDILSKALSLLNETHNSHKSHISHILSQEILALIAKIIALKKTLFPQTGKNWTIPEIGMEFVWVKSLNCWSGKYEVTNSEYRKYKSSHNSKSYYNHSLNGGNQPVVYVNFYDAQAYAHWLTNKEKAAERLPSGYKYRLPTKDEWMAIAQCGDGRKYPWGNNWPPRSGQAGNYNDETGNWRWCGIDDYNDGHAVTCDVNKSWANSWMIYGVGGNVWELTRKSSLDSKFDAWRGGSWNFYDERTLQSSYRNDYNASYRNDRYGFRLFLSL